MTLAYIVECKDYELSKKATKLAVKELNKITRTPEAFLKHVSANISDS
jgi:hypothetical protein